MFNKTRAVKQSTYGLIIIAMFFYLFDIFLQVSPSVMMQQLMGQFNFNALTYGNMAAIYFYIYTIMQLPVGVLYDRFGVRAIMIFALVLCVVGTLVFALAQIKFMLYLGRFCMGMGSAFAYVGVLKSAARNLQANKISVVVGITMTLGTIGGMSGNLFLTHLVHALGWRESMLLTFAFGMILLIMLAFFLLRFEAPPRRKEHKHKKLSPLLIHLLSTCKRPALWANGLISFFLYIPLGVFATLWAIPFLKQALGYSPQTAAIINSLLFLGFGIGSPTLGYWSQAVLNRKRFLITSSFVGIILLVLIIYVPQPYAWLLGIEFFAIGFFAGAETLTFAIAKELTPPSIAAIAFAFTNMIICIGISVMQPVVGALLDTHWIGHLSTMNIRLYKHETFMVALSVLPLSYLLALILLWWLPETAKK